MEKPATTTQERLVQTKGHTEINVSSPYIHLALRNTTDNFVAGKTKNNINAWEKITNDRWILRTICGYTIEVTHTPHQMVIPTPLSFGEFEKENIDTEIIRFLNCEIIEVVQVPEKAEYISNIFPRPKKDGALRIILNLKKFNTDYMAPPHFKMETLKYATESMRHNCYFASVDLSDAFYSIPVRVADRKYLRFIYKGVKYQFTALVMGLSTSPRVFSKIMKPVFAHLRARGYISTSYIDDSCLQGATVTECHDNVQATIRLMDSLGLTINLRKSVLQPHKQVTFLGFILCSETMTVRLTDNRRDELILLCTKMLM
ncbi:MAG: reverse transcriptase domain-containing protein, partial [Sedimenticola sp.]